MKSRFCIWSGELCILLFEMNEDMATGCDTNPCISIVIFYFFFGGVRWSLSPSSTKSLHAVDASWLTFSNVLKQALFVRNSDKLEVFRNHNIS